MSTLVAREGKDLIDFAHECIQILKKHPWGVDQDLFLDELFSGNPPADSKTRDFYWEEFKRAKNLSNEMFDTREEGWAWIRARRGQRPGQFFYQVVAQVVNGEVEVVIKYPVSETLYQEKEAEWLTRTRGHMRVKVANVQAKEVAGRLTGSQRLIEEAEHDRDDVYMFSTRLAEINFDTGLTLKELKELAISRRVPAGLLNAIRRSLDAGAKYQKQVKNLSQTIHNLKKLRLGAGRP